MNKINDYELLMLIKENNEEAGKILFDRYKYIIDIFINKYYPILIKYGIEKNEIESEALIAYTDAINSYQDDKNTLFKTYLSLCIKRRIIKLIRKYNTKKSKINTEAYSLDFVYEEFGYSLLEMVKDKTSVDPLAKTIEEEQIEEINKLVRKELSTLEYDVYEYLIEGLNYNDIAQILEKDPKQVDNAIQRIRTKLKTLFKN